MTFREFIIFHIIAFASGFILDLIFGDPVYPFHPVRLIGKLISFAERLFYRQGDSPAKKRFCGLITVLFVCAVTEALVLTILLASFHINKILFCIVEALFTWQILAAKSLKVESSRVFRALEEGTLEDARLAVSMIVGRDTENLTDEGVTKAAIETVAESTNDGVIAPMLFCAIGGPALGFFYKCINTMDSMIGYKNEHYIDFGRAAAKTDDFVNFIPSRLAALLMLAACLFGGRDFSFKNALKIFLRDRFNHQSPNSAQTESLAAGALGLQLAGPLYYEGKLEEKPYIGDCLRAPEHKDIKRAIFLMYTAAILCEIICVGILICTAAIFIHIR